MAEAGSDIVDGQKLHPEQDQIAAAARWLADSWHVAPQPFNRTLRQMFGLNFTDAIKAMAEAQRIVGRG